MKSILLPCFISYHLIVLICWIVGIAMLSVQPTMVQMEQPYVQGLAGGLLIAISTGCDLIAMLVVLIWERYFPEPGKHPAETSQLQVQISERLNSIVRYGYASEGQISDPASVFWEKH
jgi:hypothetical protein